MFNGWCFMNINIPDKVLLKVNENVDIKKLRTTIDKFELDVDSSIERCILEVFKIFDSVKIICRGKNFECFYTKEGNFSIIYRNCDKLVKLSEVSGIFQIPNYLSYSDIMNDIILSGELSRIENKTFISYFESKVSKIFCDYKSDIEIEYYGSPLNLNTDANQCIVVNITKEKYDTYIGRGSKWGNPFKMNNNSNDERNRVCDEYEKWFWKTNLPNDLHELKGKKIGCFCSPLRCHGYFLAREANKI